MTALDIAHPQAGAAPRLRRFEALYRREFAFVWAAARHFGVPPAAIDDVVQEVFLVAYRRFDAIDFEVSARAWLFGVTRRVAFRQRRGMARRERRHAVLAEVARPVAEAPQRRLDDAQELERLLARLSEGTRVVWQMTELLGMSAPEIASELGLPLNTVYSRLRLAREQLRALVGDAELKARLAGGRRAHEPPPQAQSRTWALIVPSLGPLGSGGGSGVIAWAKAQATTTATVVAAGATAVILARAPEAGDPSARGMPAAGVEIAEGRARRAAPERANAEALSAESEMSAETALQAAAEDKTSLGTAPEVDASKMALGTASEAAANKMSVGTSSEVAANKMSVGTALEVAANKMSVETASEVAAGKMSSGTSSESAARARLAEVIEEMSSGTSSESAARARLAEEVALIDRAHAQLAEGDASASLATIAAHASRFPTGVLADVREAARADALCRGGAAAEAEAVARRLVSTYPASAIAQRFSNFRCLP